MRNANTDIDLDRGKRFNCLVESIFPNHSRSRIGEKLGGYTETSVRRWEEGSGLPNKALFSLIDFGVSLEWLLAGRGEMFAKPNVLADNNMVKPATKTLFDTSAAIDTAIRQCLFDTTVGKASKEEATSLLSDIMQRIEQFHSGVSSEPNSRGQLVITKFPPPANASRWNEDVDISDLSKVLTVVGEAAAREFFAGRSGMFDTNDYLDDMEIPDTTRMVRILGDSMSPVILDGQYAMIGPQYTCRGADVPGERDIVIAEVIPQDSDHAAADSEWEGVYCKRITEGEGIWYLHSINDTGDTFSIAKTNCHLWPVIGVWFAGKGKPPKSD